MRVGRRPLPVLFIHLPPTDLLPLDRQIKAVSDIAEAISAPPSMLVVGALLRDSSDEYYLVGGLLKTNGLDGGNFRWESVERRDSHGCRI